MPSGTLLLFTDFFPYKSGHEYVFLEREIEALANSFENVIVLPRRLSGDICELPGNVICDESYSTFFKSTWRRVLMGMGSFSSLLILIKDICDSSSISSAYRSIVWHMTAYHTVKWFHEAEERYKINVENTVLYSYWFTDTAVGLARIKEQLPAISVVSRAHRFDLYRSSIPWHPFRATTIDKMDRLYCIAEDGMKYLVSKFPGAADKTYVARLGVPGNDRSPRPSGGAFHVVSCSSLFPWKRVELILQGLRLTAKRKNDCQIRWTHFGGGQRFPQLCQAVGEVQEKNLTVNLMGHIPNSEVLEFYKNNPVSVFINVSESEGIPVSIMEAMSVGIPVAATDVGGVRELVTSENGYLLPAELTAVTLSDALIEPMNDESSSNKRDAAYCTWKAMYNADDNFRSFAESLANLVLVEQARSNKGC